MIANQYYQVTILPRITVEELHNVVADHTGLENGDRKYFGLAWIDEKSVTFDHHVFNLFFSSSKQYHWLSGDKKLLESELPSTAKSTGKIILHHNVK